MTAALPGELPSLEGARLRWKAAQDTLQGHALRSDLELDIVLLNQARAFPAWRGLAALAASWLLPGMPAYMGASDMPTVVLFQILGGLCLGAAVWFLVKDGALWLRWVAARRALKRGHYRSAALRRLLGIPSAGGLALVDRDESTWLTLGEWTRREPRLRSTWERWDRALPPVREGDVRVLEEAVFAVTAWHDLKRKPA